MKWLGSKLKEAVKQAKLTQDEFAKLIGVSRPTVISWMKNQIPKGWELMNLCNKLNVTPDIFFENEVGFSRPLNRLVAHAKSTKEFEKQMDDFIEEFSCFFKKDMSTSLQLTINYHKQADPLTVALELRGKIGLTGNSPIKLQEVFELARILGIFIVPVAFPPELDHKTSAFYTLFWDCNKVIFVNNRANGLDLVYFLLHEICHAVINSKEFDKDEDCFCEATARAAQFPDCYVSEVYSNIKGKDKGIVINILKDYSVKNHHSLYGIAKALDKAFNTELASCIGGAFKNLNKNFPSLIGLLVQDKDLKSFINSFRRVTPLYFEKVILAVYDNISDRKLCEILGIIDVANANDLRAELGRCANAIQTGCAY